MVLLLRDDRQIDERPLFIRLRSWLQEDRRVQQTEACRLQRGRLDGCSAACASPNIADEGLVRQEFGPAALAVDAQRVVLTVGAE